MANSTRVEVSGLKELGAAMALLTSDIAKKISFAGVLAGANIIKKSAQAKAPIAEAAYIARQKAGDKGVLVQPAIARLQEFGTVKQSPQPFLRPAYEAEKENAVKAIKDRLEKRIIKANTSK